MNPLNSVRGALATRALLWLRCSAPLTWFTAIWYLGRAGNLVSAATLGHGGHQQKLSARRVAGLASRINFAAHHALPF